MPATTIFLFLEDIGNLVRARFKALPKLCLVLNGFDCGGRLRVTRFVIADVCSCETFFLYRRAFTLSASAF